MPVPLIAIDGRKVAETIVKRPITATRSQVLDALYKIEREIEAAL